MRIRTETGGWFRLGIVSLATSFCRVTIRLVGSCVDERCVPDDPEFAFFHFVVQDLLWRDG